MTELFKVQPPCPITGLRPLNRVLQLEGYHLSYNPSSANYGSDTTAIVLKGTVFFVLNKNHRSQLQERAVSSGIDGVIDYFIEHIDQANGYSEHLMAVGLQEDLFGLTYPTLEVIGEYNVNRIKETLCNTI